MAAQQLSLIIVLCRVLCDALRCVTASSLSLRLPLEDVQHLEARERKGGETTHTTHAHTRCFFQKTFLDVCAHVSLDGRVLVWPPLLHAIPRLWMLTEVDCRADKDECEHDAQEGCERNDAGVALRVHLEVPADLEPQHRASAVRTITRNHLP